MTAFLEKLRRICASCPVHLAGWSADGLVFEVRSAEFEIYLKSYFKGTIKTFIRQLHFYGFTKSESVDGCWTFAHPKFTKYNPDGVLEITRKTRMSAVPYAAKEEVDRLRDEVEALKDILRTEVTEMKDQLRQLTVELGAAKKSTSLKDPGSLNKGSTGTPPQLDVVYNSGYDQQNTSYGGFDFTDDLFSMQDDPVNMQYCQVPDINPPPVIKRKPSDVGKAKNKRPKQQECSNSLNEENGRAGNLGSGLEFMLNGFALPVKDFQLGSSSSTRRDPYQ